MNWLQRLLRGREMEEALEKELRFQLDSHAADLMARGVRPEEAQRQARLALGGMEQVKEECRETRGTRWLTDFLQDLRYALRMLQRAPVFTAVTLATLSLAIGGATVLFSVVNGVMLKPLPYAEPARLLGVYGHADSWNSALFGEQNLAYPDFLDLKNSIRSVDLAGWFFNPGILSAPGQAEYVTEYDASANLFSVLGVPLLRGRGFTAAEDRPAGAPVAILGYSLWQRRFGGSAAALGSTITLNGARYSVIGIAAPGFRLRDEEADVYTPLGQNTQPLLRRRAPHPIGAIARLRRGATAEGARAELAVSGAGLAAQYPASNAERSFLALPLRANVNGVRSTLWLLMGAVALVLLIACANTAGLLLARAAARDRELAMRAALGAGRGRLIRQCLTESGVLALGGGALGVGLAALGLRPFIALWPGALPRSQEIALDWRVLLFALLVSVGSGVVFGLAPALRAPSRHLEQRLRAASRSLTGGSHRLQAAFVICEIGLAMVLLVSAAVLGRTLLRLSAIDTGVEARHVLTARMALSAYTLGNPARIRVAWREALDRARRVPGVEAIAAVDTVPLRSGNNQIAYGTTPPASGDRERPMALANSVTPDYLKVMGIRLMEGRFFEERDGVGSESVAVVDTVLAHDAFPGQDVIGKRLWIGLGNDPVRVVGVVCHVRYWGPAGDDRAQVRAQIYYPFAQVPDGLQRRWSELMSVAVRASGDPMAILGPLRRALTGAGNDQAIYEIHSMEQLAAASLARQRFLLTLFAVFAGLALGLASMGIYGVLSYLTAQRVPEIGVRMAMGASAGGVIAMVLRQSLGMAALGIACGSVGAMVAAEALRRSVEGMQPAEASTYLVTAAVLGLAAAAAASLPARAASRVNPITALRQE